MIYNCFNRVTRKRRPTITILITFHLVSICFLANAQEVIAEKGTAYDFSKYRTYAFGHRVRSENSEIDKNVDQSIKGLISKELQFCRLKRVDSADLIVTYTWVGPALTAASGRQVSTNEKESTLIIDVNYHKTDLVWRIKSTFLGTHRNINRTLEKAIMKGFRKFGRGFLKGPNTGVNMG
jgi:hypothetical protein